MKIKAILLSTLLLLASPNTLSADNLRQPTAPMREFRGVWIPSVINMDWPSKSGLTTAQQKAELIAKLDKAVELNLNAVILQIRPACDALYSSPYEPWSEFLTGQMGKAPEPYYDPLAFAVEETHKRGLELHAWFNPFRARHAKSTGEISANHISKTHPEWVKEYGKYLWIDPGEKAVRDYSINVIMDVVRRYDIDAVHIDDYFYPYPERDKNQQIIDFPDEPSWQKYWQSGGKLNRNDWRRENINQFVQSLYQDIKKSKPWVKFGISPFGVWRPGYPAQISSGIGQAFDAYNQIYADGRKWLVNGWLDYFSPQLYWKIEQVQQSYPVLLNWWLEQNPKGRHIWPGNYTNRVADKSLGNWPAEEIIYQVRVTRGYAGATGNIHFSSKSLMENRDGISDLLAAEVYQRPALIPASPWLNKSQPSKPILQVQKDAKGEIKLQWQVRGEEKVWLWVMQTRMGNEWTTKILPGRQNYYIINSDNLATKVESVAVSAVNRYQNQGEAAVVELKEN